MATTKLHGIRSTPGKSIEYIVDPRKTRNGTLVIANGCSASGQIASTQFETVRKQGSGRSKLLAQHIIQSFAPGEITPEQAQLVGYEFCQRLLGEDYQYILATHIDHDHIHNHIIINNTNINTHRTFETEFNQGKKSERAWSKVRELSDEICREHHLSVIEDCHSTKGKSHYEWEMDKQKLSWKSKLKLAIDETITLSEDFDDFLRLCRERDIDVVYEPTHKIDLKFRLKGQQKFTRSRTLGWYYETPQIVYRIRNYKEIMNSKPAAKIIKTTTQKMEENPALRRWAEIENMKNASKILNILSEYDVKDNDDLKKKCLQGIGMRGAIVGRLNEMEKEIKQLTERLETAELLIKLKPVAVDGKKGLTGRKLKKYCERYATDIERYHDTNLKIHEWYPDNRVPSPSSLRKKIDEKTDERDKLYQQYREGVQRNKELEYCRQQIELYLRNEQEHNRKRSRDVLE